MGAAAGGGIRLGYVGVVGGGDPWMPTGGAYCGVPGSGGGPANAGLGGDTAVVTSKGLLGSKEILQGAITGPNLPLL